MGFKQESYGWIRQLSVHHCKSRIGTIQADWVSSQVRWYHPVTTAAMVMVHVVGRLVARENFRTKNL